jgi:hypothetical protein
LAWLPTTEVGRIGKEAFMITSKKPIADLPSTRSKLYRYPEGCPYAFFDPFELSEHRGAFLKKSLAP